MDEFQIEQPVDTMPRPYVTIETTEGSDSIKINAPEGVATHLLAEFRLRQDRLREQSMADAERLAVLRREMMGGGRPNLVESSH